MKLLTAVSLLAGLVACVSGEGPVAQSDIGVRAERRSPHGERLAAVRRALNDSPVGGKEPRDLSLDSSLMRRGSSQSNIAGADSGGGGSGGGGGGGGDAGDGGHPASAAPQIPQQKFGPALSASFGTATLPIPDDEDPGAVQIWRHPNHDIVVGRREQPAAGPGEKHIPADLRLYRLAVGNENKRPGPGDEGKVLNLKIGSVKAEIATQLKYVGHWPVWNARTEKIRKFAKSVGVAGFSHYDPATSSPQKFADAFIREAKNLEEVKRPSAPK